MMGTNPIRLSLGVAVMLLATACGQGTQQASRDGAQPTSASPQFGRIDRARLLNADSEPGNWFSTGRDFGKSHYSPLAQIDRDTVGRLGFAWDYATYTRQGLEASPVVVDGIMYTSGTEGHVYALDAKTGAEIWTFDPEVDGQAHRTACCGIVNRGVAVWQGKVYVAALDGRLFALDAKTGETLWQVDTIIDHKRGYASTGAPEVAGHVVVIGNSGGEFDARGYVSAYDIDTGEFKWRFFAVPGDPKKGFEHPELEMAAKTWDPNSRWEAGLGGTPWDALVYDPELNLLYVGTGNAALYPRYDRSPSGGDNLFLTSILAIDPDTGRLKWYYQEVPGDQWDYTATQPIILADLQIDGTTRKVLMQAPKDGIFYVLDRETGEFISGKPFVPVNWGSVDPVTGKPTVNDELVRYGFNKVKLIFPSAAGGHGWAPMAYSRDTGLVYIPAFENGNYMVDIEPGHKYRKGLRNTGNTMVSPDGTSVLGDKLPPEVVEAVKSGRLAKGQPSLMPRTFLRAWNPVTQEKAWDFEVTDTCGRSGVLATAGGLVFFGGNGHFCVLDDRTGKLLKDIEVGSSIVAAPVTYTVDGEQYVAVMAAVGAFASYAPIPGTAAYKYGNNGRILAFKLDGGPTPLPPALPDDPPFPKPPAQTADAATIQRGAALFNGNCNVCHQNTNNRGAIPDLRRMSPETHAAFNDIVLRGQRRVLGMPQWDDVFSEADADAMHAYLISLAWKGYEAAQTGKASPLPTQGGQLAN